MYLVSKVYGFLIQPTSLIFLLTLAALAAGLLGWRRLQWGATALTAAILFVSLYTTTGALLTQVLEARFPRPQALASPPACIVVLGGGFESEVSTGRQNAELNTAGDRLVEMMRLARRYPEAKIIVSGGDGHMSAVYDDDTTIAMRLIDGFDIDPARIIPERLSRNTFENAVNTAAILKREKLGPCLLVTSAFHMPRAVGMFRVAGVTVIPWPVDYDTDGKTGLSLDFYEPTANFNLMTTALLEWSGLAGNYLAGRTGDFFPAP